MNVSVVIPTRNRSALVARAIECIESQTIAPDFYEVIIIDNNSSDDTRPILEQKSKKYSNLRYTFQTKRGAAATRNAGLRIARGELVLFIDDDVQAEPDLIRWHVEYQKRNPGASVIGAVTIPWGDTREPFHRYLRDRRILNPYTPSKGPIDFSYYHTSNVSTLAESLTRVGGFNEGFNIYGMEDIELGYRLEKSGSRMIFAPEAKAQHYRFPGYLEFIGRCEEAGYSLGCLLALHPELKQRFVENGRLARHLKNFHPLYKWSSWAMKPVLSVLTALERRRGTGRISRLLDLHYQSSVRYHFFLGYRRYLTNRNNPPLPSHKFSRRLQKKPSNEWQSPPEPS